ncbi:MAG: hypothetical protein GXP13_02975 [Gammaproteobacteria bacterium]|nr:hypothetical protein [Gammaproteobacteria bacterium]
MQIPTNQNIFQAIAITQTSEGGQNWKPGQILQARVVSDVVDGLVNLRIGTTILTAQIKADLEINQKLTLEVIKLGEKPLLQLIAQDKIQSLVETAIRTILPRQQSHAQLLSNLVQALSDKQLLRFPENIQSVIKRLYQSLPDINSLRSADGVKMAINNSGLFLEAKLVQNNPPVAFTNDFKANLLRLVQALQQVPTAGLPIKPSATVGSPAYPQTTNQTSSQANSVTSAQTPVRPDFIPVRQHFTPVPAGVFLRTANPGQLSTPVLNINSPSNAPSGTTSTITIAPSAMPLNTPQPAQQSPLNRFFLPLTSVPATGLGASSIPGQNIQGGVPINSGAIQTIPIHMIMQKLTSEQGISRRIPLDLIYPGNMPYKTNVTLDNERPSARFTQLDNLSKVLSFFLKDADSSLARIQFNQLTHQSIDPEQKPSWVFEIPVKNDNKIDLFQFKIEKDDENNNETDNERNGWTIQISFNITELGQIYSSINIHQKLTSITFWSEQKETVKMFQQHIKELHNDLEDAGLIVDNLSCIEGCPPHSFNQQLATGILDEKA